jgi:hypothetical protein
VLLRGGWDSKRPVDEIVRNTLFGFLTAEDGDGEVVDTTDLVGRCFRVVDADDRRIYLEEIHTTGQQPSTNGRK